MYDAPTFKINAHQIYPRNSATKTLVLSEAKFDLAQSKEKLDKYLTKLINY